MDVCVGYILILIKKKNAFLTLLSCKVDNLYCNHGEICWALKDEDFDISNNSV